MPQKTVSEQTLISGGLRRPTWICRNRHQRAIFVCDSSGSMAGQKAAHASAARSELVDELAKTENKDAFSVGVIEFDGSARVVHRLEKATRLAGRLRDIQPGLCVPQPIILTWFFTT